ncbi:hypothetical protein pipiens_008019 [Culex pipiens pipiens]|uniref:Uncharacterized protein n=1 Tax=Culex pipiens pipiens TaxID=38569 RepID=A0ABD1DIZ5_CULPP|nr:glycine-rich cell wall structural protein-like [Culex quinquefasciatus]
MMKLLCIFALVSVALASTVQLPAESLPVHVRRVREAEGSVVQKDAQEAPVAAGSEDLEGAETFFHKKIYVVPSYGYGGYHGGYYGHGYGYGGYGYGGYGHGGYGGYGYGYPHYY